MSNAINGNIAPWLVLGLAGWALAGCGADSGSGADSEGDTDSETPSETSELDQPQPTLTFDQWRLTLSWPSVDRASHYRVFENPDGMSGYTQIGPDLSATEYTHPIALVEQPQALYLVAACDADACVDSDVVTLASLDAGVEQIALSGEAAPGLGQALFATGPATVFDVDVNDVGTVLIHGRTNQTDAGGSVKDALFNFKTGAGLELLVADDTTLPSSSATYNGFLQAQISGDDSVVFTALLDASGAGVTGLNNEVLVRATDTGQSVLAREESSLFALLDSGSVYFTENISTNRLFSELAVEGDGDVLFKPGSNTDAFNASDDSTYYGISALWRVPVSGTREQILYGQAVDLPGGVQPNFFGGLNWDLNAAGQLLFGASLINDDGSATSSSTRTGIYRRDADGSFHEVVRQVGGSGRRYIHNLNNATLRLDDDGNAFYKAQLDVATGGDFGIYTDARDGSDFMEVTRAQSTLVLDDGSYQGTGSWEPGFADFDVGGNKDVIFMAISNGGNAVLLWRDGSKTRPYLEGDPVNGLLDPSGVEIQTIGLDEAPRMRLNDNGWIVFMAEIDGAGLGLLATSPSGYTRLLLREQSPFSIGTSDYGTVSAIDDWSLDNTNRATVTLRFSDNRQGVFSFELCGSGEPC